MATISGTINNGITLDNSGSYASPLTITATGAVVAGSGDAIYGPGTQASLPARGERVFRARVN